MSMYAHIDQLLVKGFYAKGRVMNQRGQGILLVLSLLTITACAAYTPPPLPTTHPAHPEAAAAPESIVSTTLAYSPSDIPSPAPAVAMVQRTTGDRQMSDAGENAVVGEGSVIAVVPASQQVVLDHQEIKGFMDAMTMVMRVIMPHTPPYLALVA